MFPVSHRPAKAGGDDSDDEDGASRPKKQRKFKERKRIEKVMMIFCSFLVLIDKEVIRSDFFLFALMFSPNQSVCHHLSKARSSQRPSSLLLNHLQMRMD